VVLALVWGTVSTAALVLTVFAIALAAFGVLFSVMGQRGERAYWSQRDPSGNPNSEATPLRAVALRTWRYAAGEVRAPLRIMAIGILMLWLALACIVVAGVLILLP